MFKFLKEQSSKITLAFSILSVVFYLDINKYKVNNIKDINITKNLIQDETLINPMLEKIKKSKTTINIVVLDSNINTDHPTNIKGIIDENLKNYDVSTFFLPFKLDINKDTNFKELLNDNNIDYSNISLSNQRIELKAKDAFSKSLKYLEYIEKLNIISLEQNKKIYINESFGNYPIFNNNNNNKLTFNDLIKFNDYIEYINNNNKNLIKILNTNPNLTIAKSAGNDLIENPITPKLKIIYDRLTNNNYEKTKELSMVMTMMFDKKINGENIDKDVNQLKSMLEPLCQKVNVNFDNFISYSIKDYLIHYDKLSLLKQSKNLTNNNLYIVEAYNEEKILDNYNDYKKYHKIEIKELENFFTLYEQMNANNLNYNKEDINKLHTLYENNKDKYPEVFKYTKYGTFSNFQYHDTNILKRDVEGHNSNYKLPFTGTSAACPEFLSNLIIEKEFNQEHNINFH